MSWRSVPLYWLCGSVKNLYILLIQFNSNCPTLTPKVTSGKKPSQCRERVFKQKRFQFTLENVRVCYFLNCMAQAVLSFRPINRKTTFAKLKPSSQWLAHVSSVVGMYRNRQPFMHENEGSTQTQPLDWPFSRFTLASRWSQEVTKNIFLRQYFLKVKCSS